MEKIFITGATGFIGSHLIARLANGPEELVCLVRKQGSSQKLAQAGVTQVVGDITDFASVSAGMQGCSRVIYSAGMYSMWRPDPAEFFRVNVEGLSNVLRAACSQGKLNRMVNISTAAVFGRPKASPFDEESEPGEKVFSEYARSKQLADRAAWAYARQEGLPLTALYPGIVLGSGDHKASGQYIQDFIFRRIPSTIFHSSRATYIYIGDVVDAIIRATWDPAAIGQRYLLGGESLTGSEYSQLIHQVSGVAMPPLLLPDWIVISAARLLTALAKLTGISPLWGLSTDASRTLQAGFYFSGLKARRELGLQYTPVRAALEEAIASYRQEQQH